MKVILIQDVKTLGKKDAIIEVSDGYARNYLIPKGFAMEASKGNLNDINNKKEAQKAKQAREEALAKDTANALEGKSLKIKGKAGENGKLFGAISNKDIADEIKKQMKIDIDKKKIEIKEPIKNVGTYEVDAKIYPGVSAKFNVIIEA